MKRKRNIKIARGGLVVALSLLFFACGIKQEDKTSIQNKTIEELLQVSKTEGHIVRLLRQIDSTKIVVSRYDTLGRVVERVEVQRAVEQVSHTTETRADTLSLKQTTQNQTQATSQSKTKRDGFDTTNLYLVFAFVLVVLVLVLIIKVVK